MISIKKVSKSFGPFQALRNIDLDVKTGELVALLGPSGCGKTTLLRIIAGLESVDSGSIISGDQDITGHAPQSRKIGFVFQHFALFRHMTVFDNIAFGLTARPKHVRLPKQEIRKKVSDLLKLIQMEWLADAFPGKLSGGQRQRVALARALAIEPSVLLLDEPFSSLDATVRRELRRWLKRLQNDLHITSIFVTHDQEEALEVANRVVVMNQGKIEQIGTPEEVYEHPANKFVYQFLGDVNVFKGRLSKGHFDFSDNTALPQSYSSPVGPKAVGYIRPDEIDVIKEPSPGLISASVVSLQHAGPIVRMELRRDDGGDLVLAELKRNVFKSLDVHAGDKVYLNIEGMKVFVDEGVNI
jgi:sulfate/thiosulfate transport system ATP-binding protein